ncbi:MAG: class I SAM-dependent methyltransferase [Candidatus Helarchaeota archaeon]
MEQIDDSKLEQYYENEGLKFTLNDYYIGIYQMYSSHACRIAIIKKWLKHIKNGNFCDIGCGFGYFTHHVARRGIQCVGIDISENKLKIARKIAEKEGLNCKFYKMDIHNLNFKDNYFKWTLCSQVLEHVKDDIKVLKEIYRITKNYAVITVPKKAIFWDLLDRSSGIRDFDTIGHGHFREYRSIDIINKVKNIGFKILRIKFAGFISPRVDLIFSKIPFMQAIVCLLLRK